MPIILIIILVSVLSGPNMQDPFVFHKEEKLIKRTIQDPERRKEAVHSMKSYKKDWKKLGKMSKKHAKSFSKLNKDFHADSQDMENLLSEFRMEKIKLKIKLVDIRLEFQQMMTADEWEVLISKIERTSENFEPKKDKNELKTELKKNKILSKIEGEIEAAFTDPQKVAEVREDLDRFEEDLANLLFVLQEEPAALMEVIRNQDATHEELSDIFQRQEDYLIKMQTSYLSLRSELQQLSTEDQWPKIAKALNKLI